MKRAVEISSGVGHHFDFANLEFSARSVVLPGLFAPEKVADDWSGQTSVDDQSVSDRVTENRWLSPASQWNIPVFLPWDRVALIFKQRQGSNQFGASLCGFNYFVNKSTLSSNVRIGELVLEFIDARSARRRLIRCLSNLAPVQNINCSLRTHYGNLGAWPGKVDVGANVL